MPWMTGYLDLLVLGILAIFVVDRVARWMHRRGSVQWKPRGTSSALGNAVMQVQLIYQPQVREVLEQRLQELDEAGESGDPPSDGVDDDAARAVGDVGDENRPR
jgi:hypothetical protein